jgi:uncharacterized protein YegJ (DUF2314 family)
MKQALFTLFVAASILFVGGCNRKPETLTDQYDKKKMEQAIADARSSFDEFLVRFRNPQPGDEEFHVKVRIEDKHGVEHFWVSDLKLDSEPYSGKIADDPGIVKKVKFGQVYAFTRSEISDWMYMAKGKMQGNYTLHVELESMPKKEADALKRKIGW